MKFKFKKSRYIIAAVVLLSISIFAFKTFDDDDDFNISKNLEIYHSVIKDIRLYYVDEVNLSKLIEESISELLAKLDPYTVYYPESEIEHYTFMTTGAYGGIGATISSNGKELIVREIYKNSPALKAGLVTGDKIVFINGKNITEKNIEELKELIKGEPGSTLYLKVKRYNSDQFVDLNIVRGKIQIENIIYSGIINKNIAYIKLGSFKQNSAAEFKNTFVKLKDSVALAGLIIDLRDNPGGLLNEAVSVVNLFIEKGQIVVSTKGKVESWNADFKTDKEPVDPKIPITVLVNSSSASASEIVAGALQDLDRAVIIGTRTYGKGLVQVTRDLVYNTKIKITTAKYYIPSGRCIQILDYEHRNPDGSAGNIPDSLISEFKTLKGRKVYDGGGVMPDIEIKSNENIPIYRNLYANDIIFNFCTKYYFENQKNKPAKEFQLSDEQFYDFVKFAQNSNIKYTNSSDEKFDKLINSLKNEGYSEDEIKKAENLKSELSPNLETAIIKNKEFLKHKLEAEIILHYYFFDEKFIHDLKYDVFVNEASNIIKNKENYSNILK